MSTGTTHPDAPSLIVEFTHPRAALSEDGKTLSLTVKSSRPDVTGAELTFHYPLEDLIGTTAEEMTERHRQEMQEHLQAALRWGELGPLAKAGLLDD